MNGKPIDRELIHDFVRTVVSLVPTGDNGRLRQFVEKLQPASDSLPDLKSPVSRCYLVQKWFFCFRRYDEPNLRQSFLEIHPGTEGEFWGFLRLNPWFYDDEGKNRRIWELTHAFAHPQFRGNGINALYVAVTLALAKANKADYLVANPRHVSMLITLSDNGFRVRGAGGGAQTVKRIIHQGRAMYGKNTSARRLFYAQELRSVIQDGSVMMEKRLSGPGFFDLSLFGIPLRRY